MKTILVGAMLAGVLISFSSVQAQNLVQDPGFESSYFDTTDFYLVTPDWSFGDEDTGYIADGSYLAHSGDYAAEFVQGTNGDVNGYISQALATTPGVNYNISFYLYLPTSPGLDSFVGNIGGSVEETQYGPVISGGDNFFQVNESDMEQGNNAYTLYTASFTATSSNMNLIFSGASPDPTYLDDISVIAVPEPSTWAMLFGSVALIGVLRLRRRRA